MHIRRRSYIVCNQVGCPYSDGLSYLLVSYCYAETQADVLYDVLYVYKDSSYSKELHTSSLADRRMRERYVHFANQRLWHD